LLKNQNAPPPSTVLHLYFCKFEILSLQRTSNSVSYVACKFFMPYHTEVTKYCF